MCFDVLVEKKDIKGLQKRKLLVIHNLMNISTVDGIKQFIRDILLFEQTYISMINLLSKLISS